MYILGISAFYHDSAAVLIKDGKVICAAEEERFTRIKHDNSFPAKAIDFCLQQGGISPGKLTAVAYYEKPLLKFERIVHTFVATYPRSLIPFLKGIPEWLDHKIKVEHTIKKKLKFNGKVFFIPHHLSHASATFYPSSFQKAAILTVDGVGEYQTTGLWYGDSLTITPLKHIDFPHSLGLLYSTFTAFLGFKVNEDEYKVMGLSAYGKPSYIYEIYKLIEVKEDGSFKLNMAYFSFRERFRMWNGAFEKLFGKPRLPHESVTKRDRDLAASIQKVTEEIYFKILNFLYRLTKTPSVSIGGGVALNALANGKIYKETAFKNVYILGPAGDSGGALGAALYTYHNIFGKKKRNAITSLSFGPSYTEEEIRLCLSQYALKYEKYEEDDLVEKVASLLAHNNIVGWFHGRMEFGPRALGARSILANPKHAYMKEKVNKVKRREQFRPFAGSVLQEYVHEYFEVPEKNYKSSFMNFCFKVKESKRDEIAAIVHKDNSCRVQTVNEADGRYYKLIKAFYELTDVPCILNTSFNLKGEPLVEHPRQALDDFVKTEMDYLVLDDFIVSI